MKKRIIGLILALSFSALFAKETPVENLYSYKLKNGMELYVAENHTVPLAYVEIAVRGGGIGQTKENAGLFHLYEHMMFKGNAKYDTEEDIQSALTKLGVSSWNGTTNTEYVNYFFTVPSSKLKEGLEFWNYAIRTPKMDSREFEAEKKVVLSEIEGRKNDPSSVLAKFVNDTMFNEEPWATSPGGTADVVQNATIAQLKEIQKDYYIPNNAALFVGGDVNPDEVYALVKKIYGSWKKGKNPWTKNNKRYTKTPFEKTQFYVMPKSDISPAIAAVTLVYRGPDAEYEREDTYAADLLSNAAERPDSYFKTYLTGLSELEIPGSDYIYSSYSSARRLGLIMSGAVVLEPEKNLAERGKVFAQNYYDAMNGVFAGSEEDTKKLENSVHKRIYNKYLYDQEKFSELLSTVRFWWCCADAEYYYSYADKIKATEKTQVQNFLEKYIKDAPALVIISVNPDVYEQTKADYEANGYEVIK